MWRRRKAKNGLQDEGEFFTPENKARLRLIFMLVGLWI